ncbi:MAG: GNAT family N-acetyltransferase [Chloroflexi bacterium]|nr:GNAT family N-acetyltransferase [Chloroflexota bacterium]
MSIHIPGPVYRIETRRLVLRCWSPVDAPLLKQAVDESLDHLRPWMPWAANEPQDVATKIERIREWRGNFDLGQDFVYGVFNQDESRVLGGSGLHTRVGRDAREIGYWIHKDFINQGLATELSAALTRVAFEIDGVNRVEIHCDPENVRSAAVPRKLGYTHEATLRQRSRMNDGSYRDVMIWTLLRCDYSETPAARAEFRAYDAANRLILSTF